MSATPVVLAFILVALAAPLLAPFDPNAIDYRALRKPPSAAHLLGTGVAGVIMRHTRSAMLQTLAADYVRTARAKSVPERLVVLKHALRNALIPVITLGAIEFGRLLSGAVLTEQVFAIPGFGKLLVDGVFNRDYAVVQAVVLVSATLYVLLNLGADVLYFLANPRLRDST